MPEVTLRERRGLGPHRSSVSLSSDVDGSVVKSPLKPASTNGHTVQDSEKTGNGTDAHLKFGSDSHASHRSRRHPPEARPPTADKAEVSSVWFDAPLALALFPTLGTFLTGGEHVRDFLLLLVMLYYLHQLVKVPWDLYTLSRTRRRTVHETPSDGTSEQPREAKLARSELHSLSLLFLTFTVISPLIGAYILRSATSVFLGKEALSWFSTTVFVLASGIRPWRHLVELLRHRTLELQTVVQHADRGLPNDALTFLEHMDNMEKQIAQLLDAQAGMKSELARLHKTIDQSTDETEKLVRRHSRKTESDRQASNIRIEALETKFDTVVSELRSTRGVYVRRHSESLLAYFAGVASAITAPLWGATGVREGPARGFQRSVRARKSQHNLTRIPEEGGERDEAAVAAKPVIPPAEEREWHEYILGVAIAPVRHLRGLLVFILTTVKTYLLP